MGDYVVPDDFNLGIDHTQERNGIMITYHDGNVAALQQRLISCFNQLASAYKVYTGFQGWVNQAVRVDTSYMEARRDEKLEELRVERDKAVDVMVEILKAGAEPLPPVSDLDRQIADALRSERLLLEHATVAVGGVHAIEAFRVNAANSITNAITKQSDMLQQQQAQALAEQQAQALAEQQAQALAEQQAKALAEQQAAEAQAREDAKAKEFAQGPSAAAGRRSKAKQQEKENDDQRRNEALVKYRARVKELREKRQGREGR